MGRLTWQWLVGSAITGLAIPPVVEPIGRATKKLDCRFRSLPTAYKYESTDESVNWVGIKRIFAT